MRVRRPTGCATRPTCATTPRTNGVASSSRPGWRSRRSSARRSGSTWSRGLRAPAVWARKPCASKSSCATGSRTAGSASTAASSKRGTADGDRGRPRHAARRSGPYGREGRFHGLRNRDYGTNVVAGVTPGKGGQDADGVPIFDTVADAVAETGANTTMVFVPARFAADAIYEAVDAGIGTVICIAEGLPAHEMLRIYTYIRPRGITMLGPNCPGALSPGKANVGIIPAEIFREGAVGVVSRSGTLTYQI